MSPPDLRVHFSEWAGQPDIHILCDDTWTTPAWGPESAIQKSLARREIFLGDNERYYTFKRDHVSCKACQAKMSTEAA